MSSASPFRRSYRDTGPRPGAQRIQLLLVDPIRRIGFWSAVVIPFVLLGLVVAGSATERPSLLGALVAANVLAIRLGHGHGRD